MPAILGSFIAVGVMFAFVVWPQWGELQAARQEMSNAQGTAEQARRASIQAKEAYDDMVATSNALAQAETGMATGDVYSWVVRTFEALKANHHVQLSQIDPPEIRESNVLPKAGYRRAKFTVSGRATYHDLGSFLADFENKYPFARLTNLEIHAPGASRGDYDESEELRFAMDVTVAVRSDISSK